MSIVQVATKKQSVDQDKDLERLAAVPRISPLTKGSLNSADTANSSWTDYFSAFSSSAPVKELGKDPRTSAFASFDFQCSEHSDPDYSLPLNFHAHNTLNVLDRISHAPIENILVQFRNHAKTVAGNVAQTQSKIGERIISTDEHCSRLITTVSTRVSQAKSRMDSINKAATVRKCAETTRNLLDDILRSIVELDPFLLPNERLDSSENMNSYPKLTKIRLSSPKRTSSPERVENPHPETSPSPRPFSHSIMIPPRRTSSQTVSPSRIDEFPSDDALSNFISPNSNSYPATTVLQQFSLGSPARSSYDAGMFPRRSSSLHSSTSLTGNSGAGQQPGP
ncbi:hypothetical protein CcCBS67573_g01111 [Chytriomyces confervae]|uniref:BLOC-1-related complex subunit 5 n=1 Tax=Chytriomyces confervae TaxID=246404 RepID=A0A507FPU2_9FUNG|nr:hypothetical protein CcCBS67573_g01111 [Chytriomyces confervae]